MFGDISPPFADSHHLCLTCQSVRETRKSQKYSHKDNLNELVTMRPFLAPNEDAMTVQCCEGICPGCNLIGGKLAKPKNSVHQPMLF